jgi:hypothetical protein
VAGALTWAVGAFGRAPLCASQAAPQEPAYIKGLIPRWTGLVDLVGHCRFSVPPAWQTHNNDRLAVAPDGAITAEEAWLASVNWPGYRSRLPGIHPLVVHENSDKRVWVEYDAGWPGRHHHVAVPTTDGACTLRIDVRPNARDTVDAVVRQIVGSLVSVP